MKIRTVVPAGSDTDHIREAMSLSPDPYLDLFELSLPAVSEGTKVYLSPRGRVVWAGKTFEGISCELTGANSNTTGEAVRPKFQVLNLAGLFSLYVAQRKLDNATLRRYRVLSQHLLNDQLANFLLGQLLHRGRRLLAQHFLAYRRQQAGEVL